MTRGRGGLIFGLLRSAHIFFIRSECAFVVRRSAAASLPLCWRSLSLLPHRRPVVLEVCASFLINKPALRLQAFNRPV